jgi:hypothetical protein
MTTVLEAQNVSNSTRSSNSVLNTLYLDNYRTSVCNGSDGWFPLIPSCKVEKYTLKFIHSFSCRSQLEHRAPFQVYVITHTRHTAGTLWTSYQPVAESSTYTGQHNRQTSMSQRDSNPRSQQPSGHRLPWLLVFSRDKSNRHCPLVQIPVAARSKA